MKKKIHSRRLLLSTHEWSSNDGDYEHYARPGAMITIMMIEQNNFQPKHWLKHHPFDGFLQILFGGFSVKEEEGVNPIIHQLFCKQIFAKGEGRCPLVYWCTIFSYFSATWMVKYSTGRWPSIGGSFTSWKVMLTGFGSFFRLNTYILSHFFVFEW